MFPSLVIQVNPVPQGNDFRCAWPKRCTVWPGKAEIAQFQDAPGVQQVGHFDITVNDLLLVQCQFSSGIGARG